MRLEEWVDFLAPDDIRIKGTRVGIETVLYEHLHRGRSCEEIALAYPSLTPEQVDATLRYCRANGEVLDHYMADWLDFGRRARQEQERNPPAVVKKLRDVRGTPRAVSYLPLT